MEEQLEFVKCHFHIRFHIRRIIKKE